MQEMQLGRLMMAVSRVSAGSGIRVPQELTMVGKTLLNLDLVGRTLAPRFAPNDAIRRNAADMMRRRMAKQATASNAFQGVLEVKDFVQRLPGRINTLLDKVAHDELKINVDAIDEAGLMEGFQKVANRITVGLILAALIVGAAMLMRVETSFRIWGYPGLAILLFVGAAGGGAVLVVNILASDVRARRRKRRP
jgi:predicted unusual protein kinase regulating ubiquinone biosynthesis (AarF/ABC1/UbiB family)